MRREIPGYRIERELGRGGMAVVYLAHQLRLGRLVALKELAALHAADATATTRFTREARLAASLAHPNIVTVHEYFEHDGLPYMAMEVLPRGSLRPLVGILDLAQSLAVLDGILGGLAHASERGIVHRDLKPENVMRADDGTVKIADFGIAIAQDGLAAAHVTPAGEFVGSPAYVSPEQVLGGEATTASDLYSVGVIAYELLTGEVPFAGGSMTNILLRKVKERPPSVRHTRPDLDRELVRWVDRLLDPNPAKRPSDPATARDSLEEIAERVIGPRWRRDGALPLAIESRTPVSSTVARPGFVPWSRLRERGGLALRARDSLTQPIAFAAFVAVAASALLVDSRLFAVAVLAYGALAAIAFFEDSAR